MKISSRNGLIASGIYLLIFLLDKFLGTSLSFFKALFFVVSFPAIVFIAVIFYVTDIWLGFAFADTIPVWGLIFIGMIYYFLLVFLISFYFRKKI